MTPESRQKLKSLLLLHESYRQFPYTDTTGNLTIGIGRNLTSNGISTNEALVLLDDDIFYLASKVNKKFPYFSSLDENRQIALLDMCFNLGFNGFSDFTKMHLYLSSKNYDAASDEMLNSEWAAQVGDRSVQLAEIVKTGELNV